jgi:hypothetical protein
MTAPVCFTCSGDNVVMLPLAHARSLHPNSTAILHISPTWLDAQFWPLRPMYAGDRVTLGQLKFTSKWCNLMLYFTVEGGYTYFEEFQ